MAEQDHLADAGRGPPEPATPPSKAFPGTTPAELLHQQAHGGAAIQSPAQVALLAARAAPAELTERAERIAAWVGDRARAEERTGRMSGPAPSFGRR